jgi:kynurenine 3-monooxygenase
MPLPNAAAGAAERDAVRAAAASREAPAAAPAAGAGKRAVVVGAGPAGALTAMLLAKQGFKVDVFERLAPQRGTDGALQSTSAIGSRSYNILLTERAVLALEAAGADLSGYDISDLQTTMPHK